MGHALSSVSEMLSDMILEGLCKSKLQNSAQHHTVVAFVWSSNGAKQGAELSQIEDSCKTSYWSDDENWKLPRKFLHPPVCKNYKTVKGCVHGENAISDTFSQKESPKRSRRNVVKKDQLRYWRSLFNWVVYLAILTSYPRKSTLRESGKLGSKHSVKFSKGTWHQIKILESKGPSQGIMQKCAPHERTLCSPTFEVRSHEETLHQERFAPQSSVGFGETCLQAQEFGQNYVLYSYWSKGDAGHLLQRDQRNANS